jgi:hypothetical protein
MYTICTCIIYDKDLSQRDESNFLSLFVIYFIISVDRVDILPSEGPKPGLGYDHINNPEGQKPGLGHNFINNEVISNIEIDNSINSEVDDNDLRINKILRTHTISSISCGDFHSAAISRCEILYTWGSSSKVHVCSF